MNLLIVQLGTSAFAFVAEQVQEITPWPPPSGGACVVLSQALGLPSGEACERGLLAHGASGERVTFGVPGTVRQCAAAPRSLARLPAVLKRLRPPAWLAGFYHSEQELAPVVNLRHLTDADAKARASSP